ncbi:MAG: hypothetical protein R3A52_26735 [Polyangiales bacterium]
MSTYNLLRARISCPHCGASSMTLVECAFGYTAYMVELSLGSTYPWVPRKAERNGGRPPDGTGLFDGYAECDACDLDFFVDVHIVNDIIVSASASLELPGYKTAAPPGGTVYFDQGDLDPTDADRDFHVRAWYSRHLSAMDEPSFLSPSQTEEAIRFLWLPTFEHPISVRASRVGAVAHLHWTVLDGAGGYDPGVVLRSGSALLSLRDHDRLLEAVTAVWRWRPPNEDHVMIVDGAQWVFEGVRSGVRHVAHRCSPGEGPFHDAGLLFMELAGLAWDGVG